MAHDVGFGPMTIRIPEGVVARVAVGIGALFALCAFHAGVILGLGALTGDWGIALALGITGPSLLVLLGAIAYLVGDELIDWWEDRRMPL